ncbi:hypothetical protein HPB48_007174 [Haemaphysalis longicornis]|uniref:Tick transposon n=1 Tax=Haemaphysalis longicornis TaxID=44386 RepID=A0A9J6G4M0_HAELO|nr:hypothetical protein HPB48_007174 [Haemaphysalis longicornis]
MHPTPHAQLLPHQVSPTGPSTTQNFPPPKIYLFAHNTPIPQTTHFRILVLHITSTRSPHIALTHIKQYVVQTSHLLRRVAIRQHGVGGTDRIRLLESFLISRLTYHLPFAPLTQTQHAQLNGLIRKAYCHTLLLPPHASTTCLTAMGLHNTTEELIEAQRSSQILRLSRFYPGHHILASLNINPIQTPSLALLIPPHIRRLLLIKTLPRNMNPLYHAGRHMARAKRHSISHQPSPITIYVDAAQYPNNQAHATSMHGPPHPTTMSVLTPYTVAEEVAIALVIVQQPQPTTILSDSQHALSNYLNGRISPQALPITLRHPLQDPVELLLTPAHTGLGGNEAVHSHARELNTRAPASFAPNHSIPIPLYTYFDITLHHRLNRRTPPPPPQLPITRGGPHGAHHPSARVPSLHDPTALPPPPVYLTSLPALWCTGHAL